MDEREKLKFEEQEVQEQKEKLPYDNKKRILIQTRNHILKMPNNKKRVELIKGFSHLFSFYQTAIGKNESDEEIKDNNRVKNRKDENDLDLVIDDDYMMKYYRYIYRDTARNIIELENNAPLLKDKLQQIIDYYKENEFCNYEYIKDQKVNSSILIDALRDFMALLGDDVFKIFCDIIINDNIYYNSLRVKHFGYSCNSSAIDNTCIVIRDIPSSLYFYITLAHEFGHCYQNYLLRNQCDYSHSNPYWEITSMLFEKLFIEYLKNNHLIDNIQNLYLENHLTSLNTYSVSKFICDLFIDKKIGIIDPFSLSYTFDGTKEDFIKSLVNDCGYVKPFKFQANLYETNYSFGSFISSYFFERLKNDFDTEWKNYKNFICTVSYLPMKEVIETYFDVDLIKEDIKKLTKSYRER